MPSQGHHRVHNTDSIQESATLESDSIRPPQINNETIPGYRAPQRREVPDFVPESAGPEATASASAPEANEFETLPDASVASFGGENILEVVIGQDDRVRVPAEQMGEPPWRMICALRIESQRGQQYVGTGWFIAPGVLATAGHCVFMHDDGGWAKSVTVIPEKDGRSEPLGRLVSTRFGSVDGWTRQRSRDFDYGVIFLDDSTAGRRLGNFEVMTFSDSELTGVIGKVSGYPADRDRASIQYFHERALVGMTPTQLFYDVDTFGGQSGSPVWLDTQEFGLTVMAIHTMGMVSRNGGTRITGDVLENLIEWTKA